MDVDAYLASKQQAMRQAPEDSLRALHLAVLYIWFQRDQRHGELCRRWLAEAEDAGNATTLERAAKACLIHPGIDPQMAAQAADISRTALRQLKGSPGLLPWAQLTAGIANLRIGSHDDANELLTTAASAENPLVQGPALFFRSILRAERGDAKEARRDFEAARRLMPPVPDRDAVTPALDNHDQLVFWLAYDEARLRLGDLAGAPSETD
jgi:hypothetical protein